MELSIMQEPKNKAARLMERAEDSLQTKHFLRAIRLAH